MAALNEKRAVSTRVNSVRNDDPDILAPRVGDGTLLTGREETIRAVKWNPSRAARDISLFAYFKFPVRSS